MGVAREYQGLCDILVVDTQDAGLADAIKSVGVSPAVTGTIMQTDDDKIALARTVLTFIRHSGESLNDESRSGIIKYGRNDG